MQPQVQVGESNQQSVAPEAAGYATATAVAHHPQEDPLFVIGMFRSGTSLLYALLNQHSQIALMYEGDLPHLTSLFWIPRDTTRWIRRWEFWNAALARHKFDGSVIPDGIRDLDKAVRAVYVEYARQKKNASVWGCKSPTYHDEVARLSRVFPNARFIIIWRDLRHICRSILEAAETSPFFNRRGMTLRAIIGYYDLKRECDELIKRGGRVHQIDYEEMVKDPVGHMQAVCQFLGLQYEPSMSNLKGSDRTAISNLRHHSMVKGDKILAARNGSDGIPVELRNKIERYVKLWREQYKGAWPMYPKTLESNPKKPSLWERTTDRISYELLQFSHHAAPVIFSFVPMKIWGAYRKKIAVRRIRRLLQKAGTNKAELLRKAAIQDESLLRLVGISKEDFDKIMEFKKRQEEDAKD
jgi:protein-tyrosine sulfotransferase